MRLPVQPPDVQRLMHKRLKDWMAIRQRREYLEAVRRCEAEYWSWDQMRFRVQALGLDPELVWIQVKLSREPRYRILPLFGKNGQALKYNVPEPLQHRLMLVDQQLAGGLVSADDAPPSAQQKEKFIINAFREEAIASSMLEGAATTRQEAKQMLKTGRRPRSRGEQMVLNNYQAIQFIREHQESDLSPGFLVELQKILTRDTLDDPEQVGRLRTDADKVSIVDDRDDEVMHVPPPESELPERLKAICDFANRPLRGKDFVHPVVAACVLHFQLGFDHPFCDGNGRTARALFYWLMLRSGYWLFEYLPISRLIYRAPLKYARAFLYSETDDFDITYFLTYKANIIDDARRELREYIHAKQEQVNLARKMFSSDSRLNHRQREIVLRAARNPERCFTIYEQQQQSNVTYATARADFLKLVEWGYLKKTQVGKRFEFTADERLKVPSRYTESAVKVSLSVSTSGQTPAASDSESVSSN